jgi:F-type H+-transporting ATPase subunit alpha
VNKVKEFEASYLSVLRAQYASTLADLKAGKYTDEITAVLDKVAREVSSTYAN